MTKENWELPKETDKEIKDAFVSGYAQHGIEQLEDYLKDKNEDKKIRILHSFIKRWEKILLNVDDEEVGSKSMKEKIVKRLETIIEQEKNEDIRQEAREVLDKYSKS